MNLVFFAHPLYLENKSMNRFARLISEGMRQRHHQIQLLSAKARFSRLVKPSSPLYKWLTYIDLFILFPMETRQLLKRFPQDVLYVFTDQALGPWVPLVAHKPNVIHCHDFLALQSALGQIEEQPTGWTGRLYQRFIRKGFSKGKNFISVSEKTRRDLHTLLLNPPVLSEVVYNGLHQQFSPLEASAARMAFGRIARMDLSNGYLLHVGGNTWYKNRVGVIEIYEAWRRMSSLRLPLLLVGTALTGPAVKKVDSSPYRGDIHVLTDISDDQIGSAYAGATLFLFPSLGEGFGWPIAEAMASGTLVLTTNEAPMSEVAGDAAYLIPKRPKAATDAGLWARDAAQVVERLVNFDSAAREAAIRKGLANASRFDTNQALDKIEAIYAQVLERSETGR